MTCKSGILTYSVRSYSLKEWDNDLSSHKKTQKTLFFWKQITQPVFCWKLKKTDFCQILPQVLGCFFSFSAFLHTNIEKAYLEQCLECAAPKGWTK